MTAEEFKIQSDQYNDTIDYCKKELHNMEHAYENKKALPIIVFISFICIAFKDAWICELFIWGGYLSWCYFNNKIEQRKPEYKKNRQILLDTQISAALKLLELEETYNAQDSYHE